MNTPQCCNKTTIEIQSGRVVSIEERIRYTVWFCPECGKSYVTGLLNNENFLIRFSIPKPLMFEALNNEYQRAKAEASQ